MVPRVFKPSEELEARQFRGHFLDDSGRVQSTFTCQCFGLNEAFNGTQAHSDTPQTDWTREYLEIFTLYCSFCREFQSKVQEEMLMSLDARNKKQKAQTVGRLHARPCMMLRSLLAKKQ
jgi:hypothetical protein